MHVTVDRLEKYWLMRLDGDVTIASAAELKRHLLEWQASREDLRLDLEGAKEIDIAAMQLLWAAGRDAAVAGAGMESQVSEAAAMAARDAGFERFPGCSKSDCSKAASSKAASSKAASSKADGSESHECPR